MVSCIVRCQQIVKGEEHSEGKNCARNANVDQELQEVLHVAMADTIVDPWTVVVHFEHTEATFATMVRPNRLPRFFVLALFTIFHLHELTLERGLKTWLNLARIGH